MLGNSSFITRSFWKERQRNSICMPRSIWKFELDTAPLDLLMLLLLLLLLLLQRLEELHIMPLNLLRLLLQLLEGLIMFLDLLM